MDDQESFLLVGEDDECVLIFNRLAGSRYIGHFTEVPERVAKQNPGYTYFPATDTFYTAIDGRVEA